MKRPSSPKPDDKPPASPDAFAAFRALARKLVKVPKAEIDAREAEYQRQQAKKPKRGPKGR